MDMEAWQRQHSRPKLTIVSIADVAVNLSCLRYTQIRLMSLCCGLLKLSPTYCHPLLLLTSFFFLTVTVAFFNLNLN